MVRVWNEGEVVRSAFRNFPSVHGAALRAGDVERVGRWEELLVISRAVVVGGELGLQQGGQGDVRGALLQALRIEVQQHVQFALDGLHLWTTWQLTRRLRLKMIRSSLTNMLHIY